MDMNSVCGRVMTALKDPKYQGSNPNGEYGGHGCFEPGCEDLISVNVDGAPDPGTTECRVDGIAKKAKPCTRQGDSQDWKCVVDL